MKYLLPFCLLLLSCSGGNENKKQDLVYFDLKGLISDQKLMLKKSNRKITKQVEVDGKSESVKENYLDWDKELQPFADADINRPAWKEEFAVEEVETGNLKTITYKLKEDKDHIDTKLLRIVSENGKPQKIYTLLKASNLIYNTEKHYTLELDSAGVLSQYEIRGNDKVVFKNEVNYKISSQVN